MDKKMSESIAMLYKDMVMKTKAATCKEKLMCMYYLLNMFKSKILNQVFLKGNEHSMTFTLRTTFVDGSWIENEQTQVEGNTCLLQNRFGIN